MSLPEPAESVVGHDFIRIAAKETECGKSRLRRFWMRMRF